MAEIEIFDDPILEASSVDGNSNLRAPGIPVRFTQSQMEEYNKCSEDPIYFINNHIKIISLDDGIVPFETRSYQDDIIRMVDGGRFSIVMCARQSGKTIAIVGYMIWCILFKPNYSVAILGNKESQAKVILSRLTMAYENLPKWIQQGVKSWNKLSVELENGSSAITSSSSSSAVRGSSVNLVFCVSGETKVTIVDDYGDIYHMPISEANAKFPLNNSFSEDTALPREFKKKKHYFVYKTVNLVNRKEYIGFHHTDNLDDGYLGSGKLLRRAIEKYGPENFQRIIIEDFDNQSDAEALEAKLVDKEYVDREDTYNLSLGGNV